MTRTDCHSGFPVPGRILLFLLLLSAPLLGAETWRFTADEVSSSQSRSSNITVLDGQARVESGSMIITADHLELGGEDYSLISGSGGISLEDLDRGITVDSRRFEYDRNADVIRFREQVTLVDQEQEIVIRCESLDFLKKQELVIMQVAVRLIRNDIICRGEFASYRREENNLDISGRPVVWRREDEYRADRILVDLDTDEIVMEGTVSGALNTENDNQEPEEVQ